MSMRVVIQQRANELELHAYRVVAQSVHQVHVDGRLGPETSVHISWADTMLEASKRATAAADAFGCRLVFVGPVEPVKRRKVARS